MFGNFSSYARVAACLLFLAAGVGFQSTDSLGQDTPEDHPVHQTKKAVAPEKNKKLKALIDAASRLNPEELNESQRRQLSQLFDEIQGTAEFVQMVDKFSSEEHYPDLLRLTVNAKDRQLAADAMSVLLDKKQMSLVSQFILNADDQTREIICDAVVNCRKQKAAASVLTGIANREDLDSELRRYAIKRLGQIQTGAENLLSWIDKKEEIDPIIMPAIVASLHSTRWPDIKKRANELFPIASLKDHRPLPPLNTLARKQGSAERGIVIFEGIGTCSKCHIVHGKGIAVGPDLSEIGNKLSRLAMLESILFPSAAINHHYENWMVLTQDGQVITGVLVGETESEVQIKDDKGVNHVISVDEIDSRKKQELSLMPADLHKELTEQELVDLIEFLTILKK